MDLYHLTRPKRTFPHWQITDSEHLLEYVATLVQKRGDDIAVVHLHLAATQVVPFAMGIVPPLLRDALQILGKARGGNFPVAVQFLPMFPINLIGVTSSWFLNRIKQTAEGIFNGSAVGYG